MAKNPPKAATPDAVTEESPVTPVSPSPMTPASSPEPSQAELKAAEENARLRAELEAAQVKAAELQTTVNTLTDKHADAETKVELLAAELEALKPPPPPPTPIKQPRRSEGAADDPRHLRRLYGF